MGVYSVHEFTTSGLSSGAQVINVTAGTVSLIANNVTDGLVPVIYEVNPAKLAERIEAEELVAIKLAPQDNERGFYLLVRAGYVQCLPGDVYMAKRRDLGLLAEAGVAYDTVELSAPV
jgi:hypothetical protein